MNRNEVVDFLMELQAELKEQETDGQASPRFWGIMDYKWETSTEDDYDRIRLYSLETCETTTIEECLKEIEEDKEELDVTDERIQDLKEAVEEADIEEMHELLEEITGEEYHIWFEQKRWELCRGNFYLTKQEAKDHLKANAHHYTDEAHTYAMTAWRAPKMEKLIKILETHDWRKN